MTEQIQIKIWNDKNEIVVDEMVEAPTASEQEINEMVSLIENGCPANIAANIIVGNRK